MVKKLTIFTLLVAVVVGAGIYFSKPSNAPHFASSVGFLQDLVHELPRQENFPEPLTKQSGGSVRGGEPLRSSTVISLTNKERTATGLSALKENKLLAKAAEAKIDDMLELQYFEHESPTGKGPAEIVTEAGYAYIVVGENLAEGDFLSSADLVNGWMNSPGHRANILHDKYTEIGVAVRQGTYQGREVWMAVQEFGRPAADCPHVDDTIKVAIAANESQVKVLQVQLDRMAEEMAEARQQGNNDKYNSLVGPYNDLVKEINKIVNETKVLVSKYNAQVQEFNACIQ